MVTQTSSSENQQLMNESRFQWNFYQPDQNRLIAIGVDELHPRLISFLNQVTFLDSEMMISEISLVNPNTLVFQGIYIKNTSKVQWESRLITYPNWIVFEMYDMDEFGNKSLLFVHESPSNIN